MTRIVEIAGTAMLLSSFLILIWYFRSIDREIEDWRRDMVRFRQQRPLGEKKVNL
jgi:hypothetical protein